MTPGDGVWGQLCALPASLSQCPLDGSFELGGQLVTRLPDGLGARRRFVAKRLPLLRVPLLRTDTRECQLSFDGAALETLPESLAT